MKFRNAGALRGALARRMGRGGAPKGSPIKSPAAPVVGFGNRSNPPGMPSSMGGANAAEANAAANANMPPNNGPMAQGKGSMPMRGAPGTPMHNMRRGY